MCAPFNVPALLGRPLEVSLTKDSGAAVLVFVLRQRFGLEVAKDDPRLQAVYAWLIAEFDNGGRRAGNGRSWRRSSLAPSVRI